MPGGGGCQGFDLIRALGYSWLEPEPSLFKNPGNYIYNYTVEIQKISYDPTSRFSLSV
jgi:hypothetical protein